MKIKRIFIFDFTFLVHFYGTGLALYVGLMARPFQHLPQLSQHSMGLLIPKVHLRTDLHLARKAWHMGMGVLSVCIFMLTGMSREAAVILLGLLLVLDLAIEGIRLRYPRFNEKFIRTWGPLMRQSELNRLSGTPYYLAAMLLSVAIFPKTLAVLSILYLACGDPIASIFGILYGNRGPRFSNGKSLIGTLAATVACFLVGIALLGGLGWFQNSLLMGEALFIAALGAIAGGCAELLPIEIDDNFAIPIVSGFALWIAFIVLGIPL